MPRSRMVRHYHGGRRIMEEEVFELLTEEFSDTADRNYKHEKMNGHTPLYCAAEAGSVKLSKLLAGKEKAGLRILKHSD